MVDTKFTAEDRNLVVKELERIQKTNLSSIGSSKKLFQDSNGMLYFLFGGKNDWHGIRPNAINQLRSYKKEGVLIIVKKYASKMEVCVGSLSIFIQNLDKLVHTKKGELQFHTVLTEDGMYLLEVPDLYLNRVSEIDFPHYKKDLSRLKEISKIINIEVEEPGTLTHSDVEAKLILIGSYLAYRTYTPDKSQKSIYGVLGDLCSEKEIPTGSIPAMHIDTVQYIDVIWFDEEGFPTHAFEVEHSTDITKGLLRLYQVSKLRIKMFIVADESNRKKFEKELLKNPFYKIKEEYIFRNYSQLDEFFDSVKKYSQLQERFLNNA